MLQIPKKVQDNLLFEFVFQDFLKSFHRLFDLPKDSDCLKHSRYSYQEDEYYHDFLFKLVLRLEPIKYEKDTIILRELEECNEITYLQDVPFVVGFSINKQPIFKISQKNVDIGAFGASFMRRSEFNFQTI